MKYFLLSKIISIVCQNKSLSEQFISCSFYNHIRLITSLNYVYIFSGIKLAVLRQAIEISIDVR